jgi:hypothetical protein
LVFFWVTPALFFFGKKSYPSAGPGARAFFGRPGPGRSGLKPGKVIGRKFKYLPQSGGEKPGFNYSEFCLLFK